MRRILLTLLSAFILCAVGPLYAEEVTYDVSVTRSADGSFSITVKDSSGNVLLTTTGTNAPGTAAGNFDQEVEVNTEEGTLTEMLQSSSLLTSIERSTLLSSLSSYRANLGGGNRNRFNPQPPRNFGDQQSGGSPT